MLNEPVNENIDSLSPIKDIMINDKDIDSVSPIKVTVTNEPCYKSVDIITNTNTPIHCSFFEVSDDYISDDQEHSDINTLLKNLDSSVDVDEAVTNKKNLFEQACKENISKYLLTESIFAKKNNNQTPMFTTFYIVQDHIKKFLNI